MNFLWQTENLSMEKTLIVIVLLSIRKGILNRQKIGLLYSSIKGKEKQRNCSPIANFLQQGLIQGERSPDKHNHRREFREGGYEVFSICSIGFGRGSKESVQFIYTQRKKQKEQAIGET